MTGRRPVHHGPQPYEVWLSRACEAFGALPRAGGMEDQDPVMIERIMTVRAVERALDLMQHRPEQFAADPTWGAILRELQRAMDSWGQGGDGS